MNIGYAGAFLGGILSLLSPCSVMLLPAFFAYAFTSTTKLLSRVGIFTLGLLVTLIPLGIFSGIFGSLLGQNRGVLILVVAIAIILVGLVQLFAIPVPGFALKQNNNTDRTSSVSVFLLGTVYAVAGVCTGPILGAVLMMASLGGSAAYGAVLLTVYAIGMVIPLFLITILWQRFGTKVTTWIRPRTLTIGRWQNSWVMIITGLLSIGLGLLLLLTDGTAKLAGLISIDTQYQIESFISDGASSIDDLWFIVFALPVIGLIIGVALLVNRRTQQKAAATTAEQKMGNLEVEEPLE